MTSSPTILAIAAALLKSQKEMGNAKKDAINPFFKKSYADLNSVREATLPVLNANGISVLQPTCIVDGVDYVETILLHESGEFISSFTRVITDKPNDAQRHGSGLSYARRYALASIVNIGAEDDDANLAVKGMNGHAAPPAKLPLISAKQFTQLSQRIADSNSQDEAMVLLNKAKETFTVSEKQAAELVNSISIIPQTTTV